MPKELPCLNFNKHALATRFVFFAAGFGPACWAPLVPYAKARLGINEALLGVLLLCLGTGSVCAMPLAGTLNVRLGSKPIIVASGLGIAAMLPLLSFFLTPLTMGVTLFFFGAFLGSLDVAMNLHAVEVERMSSRPMMSGFHALYSIGGFAGSGFITAALSRKVTLLFSASSGAAIIGLLILAAAPSLIKTIDSERGPLFALPRGPILLLAALAFICFLVEGALLDWSALLLVTRNIVEAQRGGLGFMLFSIAMTVARLTGDRAVQRFGERQTLFGGGLIALFGFALLLLAPYRTYALFGFILIGLGAANVVPILFRRAVNQNHMPSGLAVAAVTAAGYAGVLAGPALVGFVAHAFTLNIAFALLAVLFSAVVFSSKKITST